MDADVRLQWDSYLSAMEVVDRDPLTGTDLLHWVIKLPVSEPAAAGVCRLHPHHTMRVGPPTCKLVVKTAPSQTDLSIHDTPCTISVPPFLYILYVCVCVHVTWGLVMDKCYAQHCIVDFIVSVSFLHSSSFVPSFLSRAATMCLCEGCRSRGTGH